MPVECEGQLDFSVGSTRNVLVSFDDLQSGEVVSSATCTEVTTSDLTIANVAATTANKTIFGETVTTGRAVAFTVSGGTLANSPYTLLLTATTNSTPAQVIVRHCIVSWR